MTGVIIAIIAGIGAVIVLGKLLWNIAQWVKGIDSDIEVVKGDIEVVKGDVKTVKGDTEKIFKKIAEIFGRLSPQAVTGSSPLKLTDYGEQIATELQALQWAEKLAPTLIPKIVGMQPYEVDEFCDSYVNEHLLIGEWIERIAKAAYEFGIDKKDVLPVMRIVLRDELLRLVRQSPPTA